MKNTECAKRKFNVKTNGMIALVAACISSAVLALPPNYSSTAAGKPPTSPEEKPEPEPAPAPEPGKSGSPYARFNLKSIEKCSTSGRFGISVTFDISHEDYNPQTWQTKAEGNQGSMYMGWKLAVAPQESGLLVSTTKSGQLKATVKKKDSGHLHVLLENCSVLSSSDTPLVGDSLQFSFAVTPDTTWYSPVINLHYLNEKLKMW